MMSKLLDLFKTLMDSNAAVLATLKQPTNNIVSTVNPVINVNPTIAPVQQTVVQTNSGNTSIATTSSPAAATITLNDGDENHR